MWYGWERRENCTMLWWERPKERDLLEDQGLDIRMGLEWILRRLSGKVLSGYSWLRIVASSGLL
jgi:hypothetical protein